MWCQGREGRCSAGWQLAAGGRTGVRRDGEDGGAKKKKRRLASL